MQGKTVCCLPDPVFKLLTNDDACKFSDFRSRLFKDYLRTILIRSGAFHAGFSRWLLLPSKASSLSS
jgi:hypothetical protein